MFRKLVATCVLAICCLSGALADELTEIVQKDLVALGYDPGNISGELTTETVIAISKFQAENGLEVTGKPSPQLAGVIKAKRNTGGSTASAASQPAPAAEPAPDPEALQAAQQACLQQKAAEAQAAKKKKRGFGSLLKAAANTATRFGGSDLSSQVYQTSRDIYDVNATAQDWERAADDLGLTTDDIEACRNPSS
jgi:peptidoglycan hydrolase-like protein with peptidoglycan-binding domain